MNGGRPLSSEPDRQHMPQFVDHDGDQDGGADSGSQCHDRPYAEMVRERAYRVADEQAGGTHHQRAERVSEPKPPIRPYVQSVEWRTELVDRAACRAVPMLPSNDPWWLRLR